MPTAQGDLKATLMLSNRYEHAMKLLGEAVAERDIVKVRRANIFIDGPEFDAVPEDKQLEMLALLATALLASGIGAP